jgi:hypothetical protein
MPLDGPESNGDGLMRGGWYFSGTNTADSILEPHEATFAGVLPAPTPLLPAAIYYPGTPPLSAVEHQAGAFLRGR